MSKLCRNKTRKNNQFSNLVTIMKKKPTIIIAGSIILFLLVFTNIFISTQVSAKKFSHREKIVTSIKIQKGDSLWSIANKYISDEYNDMNSYIDEIKRTNGLTGDTIQEGNFIIVPYYTTTEVATANTMW